MKTNFEEFKSEVYRRRDQKKELNKKLQKRVVLTAVPVVLILGILTVLPSVFPVYNTKDSAMEIINEEAYPIYYPVSLTVSGKTQELSSEDSQTIINLLNGNQNVLCDNSFTQNSSEEKPEHSPSDDADDTQLRLTITISESANIHFHLEGKLLIRLDNGEERVLREDEYRVITSILEKYQSN